MFWVTRFGEKLVRGSRVLVGATSQQYFSGSLWREMDLREWCVGGSKITAAAVFWRFAFGEKLACGHPVASAIPPTIAFELDSGMELKLT